MNLSISEAANLAIHAMTYLATQKDSQPVTTAQVAQSFGFSENHLSKVFQRLTKAGLVKAIRGPRGGFILAKKPQTITLRRIYETIDGPLTRHGNCLLGEPTCGLQECVFGDLLESLHEQVAEHFSKTTLADLA